MKLEQLQGSIELRKEEIEITETMRKLGKKNGEDLAHYDKRLSVLSDRLKDLQKQEKNTKAEIKNVGS